MSRETRRKLSRARADFATGASAMAALALAVLAATALGVASCAPSIVALPKGRVGWYVRCFDVYDGCFEQVAKVCPTGHRVVEAASHEVLGSEMSSRFGVYSWYSPIGSRGGHLELTVECVVPAPPRPCERDGTCECDAPAARCVAVAESGGYLSQPQRCADDGHWYDSDSACDATRGMHCQEGICLQRR